MKIKKIDNFSPLLESISMRLKSLPIVMVYTPLRGSPSMVNGAGMRIQSLVVREFKSHLPHLSSKKQSETEKAVSLLQKSKVEVLDSDVLTYLVQGSTGDYLVRKDFCTCAHFTHRCLKNPPQVCYHILAVRMANHGLLPTSSESDILSVLLSS